MNRLAITAVLCALLGGASTARGQARGPAPDDDSASRTGRDVVCPQPGDLGMPKIPADSAEVANDCPDAGVARVVKATWWGGYIEWAPGDPDVTCFDVRFYRDASCRPTALIAEYLDATPDTTHLGSCTDSLPCFRYELDVDVLVGPEPFWMSVQTACESRPLHPLKWGRLGDEVFDGCASVLRVEGEEEWEHVDAPGYPDWEASHEFEASGATPVRPLSWSRLRALFRGR